MWATVKRDAAIFASYRFRFVGQMMAMLLTMTMFYYVSKLVRPGVVGPEGRYFAYVEVGIVSLSVLTAALNTCQLVRAELLTGTFERMVISPVGPVGSVIALAVFPILYAIALAGAMLFAATGIFGFPIHVERNPGGPRRLGPSRLGLHLHRIGVHRRLARLQVRDGCHVAIAGLSILGGVYSPSRCFPAGFDGCPTYSLSRRR